MVIHLVFSNDGPDSVDVREGRQERARELAKIMAITDLKEANEEKDDEAVKQQS